MEGEAGQAQGTGGGYIHVTSLDSAGKQTQEAMPRSSRHRRRYYLGHQDRAYIRESTKYNILYWEIHVQLYPSTRIIYLPT